MHLIEVITLIDKNIHTSYHILEYIYELLRLENNEQKREIALLRDSSVFMALNCRTLLYLRLAQSLVIRLSHIWRTKRCIRHLSCVFDSRMQVTCVASNVIRFYASHCMSNVQ